MKLNKISSITLEHTEKLKGSSEDYARLRIKALKDKLKGYDYIGTKIATGRATAEEYATQIAEMNAWADEINELEASLSVANK